jgi:hypothetical protein
MRCLLMSFAAIAPKLTSNGFSVLQFRAFWCGQEFLIKNQLLYH